MGSVKWTEEQSSAIYTRGGNLLVAAAAGSGKTAVLVQRIIEMITDKDNPVDIDRLLVVTFTNAAASEMRERIGSAISKAIAKAQKDEDIEQSKNLQRQLVLLNRASITTIHSFCLNIIKNNFHMLDLDPGFRIGDQTETELIKIEVIEEVFEEEYEKLDQGENSRFGDLIDAYCSNRDDNRLKELILKVYGKIMSLPEPLKWIGEKCQEFNIDSQDGLEGTYWAEELKKDLEKDLVGSRIKLHQGLNIIDMTPELEPYRETFEKECESISQAIDDLSGGLDVFGESIRTVQFGRLKSVKNVSDEALKKRVTAIRNDVKKDVEKVQSKILSYISSDSVEDINYMYGIMKEIEKLIRSFTYKFKEKKNQRGIIDFNDFEHYALELLVKHHNGVPVIENGWYVSSEIAEEIMERYDEILIDEYQDSNMVQEVVLNTISRERIGQPNIFMVGDVKQSIYKFRQANPKLFMDKYNKYSLDEGERYRKILLFKNFRSRKNVVQSVNFIFESLMSEEAGELQYDENERLNFGAFYKEATEEEGTVGGAVEFNMIELEEEEKEDSSEEAIDIGEEASKIEIEGRFIAERINKLFQEDKQLVFDKENGEYRPLEYRDIVVLLRSTSSSAEVIMEELKKNDIPVYADVGSGYFEATEVKVVMSLLRVIDNPFQDIHLLAVLRSPIGGFNPEEFVQIRKANMKDSFYDAMVKYLEEKSGNEDEVEFNRELQGKLKSFIDKLTVWRDRSKYTPLDQFLWSLITETGYYGFVGAQGTGIQRQGNLKILYQRAKSFENTSYKGLFNFINFIDKLKKSSGDMGAAKVIGESENVVRIMSIHKSKGLEFPVVFMSALSKQFNMQDLNGNILFHEELGFGPDCINLEKRLSYPTIFKDIIKGKMKKENLSEEMRVLYVAFTRAREKLILTSTVKDVDKYLKGISKNLVSDENKILSTTVLSGKSYLDWIVSALFLHRDGKVLREKCSYEVDGSRYNESSEWNIQFIDSKIFRSNDKEEENGEEKLSDILKKKLSVETTAKYKESVDKRLSFLYEYRDAVKIPTVTTVTELKSRDMEEVLSQDDNRERKFVQLKKRPRFMEEKKGLTPSEKGTAVHNVMQYIDFSEGKSIESIRAQIEMLVSKEFISIEEGESVNPYKIFNFMTSDIGKRCERANKDGKMYRERAFGLNVKAYEVFEEMGNLIHGGKYDDEEIKLQGIIDLFIEEDDGIVLLDFKTDYVDSENYEEIISKYKSQIRYYGEAIKSITGKKIKESYLYLFGIDRAVLIK